MNIENAKAQMRKGILEYCILSILKERDFYTSDIIMEKTAPDALRAWTGGMTFKFGSF